ncbi:insulin-degrading enzyme-like isoform X2 [Temnothorax nylanderi]
MLPMGTKKYPAQDEYDMYVSQSNGHQNATTSLNSTNYYFTAIPEKLKGGLDRFVEFFIEPRFNEDLIEKEINNIHSEYNELLTKEEYRLIALEKLSIKPDHPYSKFDAGNKETLDEIPKKLKINVGTELRKFYEKYYSANIMSLCILSKDSLDVLENMVVERFRNVENKEVELSMYSEHPIKAEDFNTKWYYDPILNIKILSISFSLLKPKREHRMPLDYIEHLLRHESKGSLLSALKARGWCDKLHATNDPVDTSIHFFKVAFHLTEEGINHVDDIVQIMFQYINMLKEDGPQKWIYEEIQEISDINNSYDENIHRLSHEDICRIACQLHEYPMEEIISEQRAWQPDLIKELMKKYFTPQNIIIYISKTYESTADKTEEWFDIKYEKEKIPEKTMDMWNHAGRSTDLKFPPENEFIPKKFDIKLKPKVQQKFPETVMDTSFVRVWHKKDDVFGVPKATMIFHFVSPFAYMDPLSSELTDVFVELVHESLNEYTYRAKLAGLKLEITGTKYGINMTINGYDDKQRDLLEKSMDQMINFKIDPKCFETLEYWDSKYINFNKNIYQNTVDYLKMLLTEQQWLNDELYAAEKYLPDNLKLFIPKLFSKMHVECLIYGNVTKDEAEGIGELIESKLQTGMPHMVPLLQKQLVLYREIKLENGCHVRFEDENKEKVTSSTIVYYATGLRSTESNMLLSLSNRIIDQNTFNTLRTKYNLGYTVFSQVTKMDATQYLTVVVQGNCRPQNVEDQINLFMEDMYEHISTMSKEEFDNHKKGLKSHLTAPKTRSSQCFSYWEEIETQEYNFNREDIEVRYLEKITQQQLRKFFEENILSKLTRRKLSVHVMPTAMAKEMNLPDTSGKITVTSDNITKEFDDLLSFKLSQSLYPLLEPIDENVVRKGIRCF